MFYSQFILAKKGPLGTIWIAAHLERKLRKNQVADTDIGVSVDSILFPDVPIALRLSSHLLLGVVRIYSRKVNYLFDDCSEALLKIKQAFRSAAVDLPPEESTAPYHSITLPETFDLDDFELPDSDIFQGNYVDHHVSSREQITLQDTMEGVVYSTSQFGLDERFGDGDTSGLDLDEELFLNKVGDVGQAGVMSSSDAGLESSVPPLIPLKQDENHEARVVNSESMAVTDDVNQHDGPEGEDNFIEYAQAPCTPGLMEEPNLSNVQETSAFDDHLESENHNTSEFSVKVNLENASSKSDSHHQGNKHVVDWPLPNEMNNPKPVPHMPTGNNGYPSDDPQSSQLKPQEQSLVTSMTIEQISTDNPDPASLPPSSSLSFQVGTIYSVPELSTVDKIHEDVVKTHVDMSSLTSAQLVPEGESENNQELPKIQVSINVEIPGDLEKSFPPSIALESKAQSDDRPDHEKLETQNYQESVGHENVDSIHCNHEKLETQVYQQSVDNENMDLIHDNREKFETQVYQQSIDNENMNSIHGNHEKMETRVYQQLINHGTMDSIHDNNGKMEQSIDGDNMTSVQDDHDKRETRAYQQSIDLENMNPIHDNHEKGEAQAYQQSMDRENMENRFYQQSIDHGNMEPRVYHQSKDHENINYIHDNPRILKTRVYQQSMTRESIDSTHDNHVLRPCTTPLNQPDALIRECGNSAGPNLLSQVAGMGLNETTGTREASHAFKASTAVQGEGIHTTRGWEQAFGQNQMSEPVSFQDVQEKSIRSSKDQVENVSGYGRLENLNSSAGPEFPAPEKLLIARQGFADVPQRALSVPQGISDVSEKLFFAPEGLANVPEKLPAPEKLFAPQGHANVTEKLLFAPQGHANVPEKFPAPEKLFASQGHSNVPEKLLFGLQGHANVPEKFRAPENFFAPQGHANVTEKLLFAPQGHANVPEKFPAPEKLFAPQGHSYVPEKLLFGPQGHANVPEKFPAPENFFAPQGHANVPEKLVFAPQGHANVPEKFPATEKLFAPKGHSNVPEKLLFGPQGHANVLEKFPAPEKFFAPQGHANVPEKLLFAPQGLANIPAPEKLFAPQGHAKVPEKFPAPEKLMFAPQGAANVPNNFLLDFTPKRGIVLDEGYGGLSQNISGKKRMFTESAPTVESLNSFQSFAVHTKGTVDSIANDNDLLSSILVGKRSSALKVKPTPPAIKSMKRPRSTPRTNASKRKVLMDDSMVLHGDTIRQQLTSTEDIRRLRKKAPCTRPEILMIQNQFCGDEIFNESILSGVSRELASLHNQTYDLGGTKVSQSNANDASYEAATLPKSISQNDQSETRVSQNDASFATSMNATLISQNDPSETRVSQNDVSFATPMNRTLISRNDPSETRVSQNDASFATPMKTMLISRNDPSETRVSQNGASFATPMNPTLMSRNDPSETRVSQNDASFTTPMTPTLISRNDPSETRVSQNDASFATPMNPTLMSQNDPSETRVSQNDAFATPMNPTLMPQNDPSETRVSQNDASIEVATLPTVISQNNLSETRVSQNDASFDNATDSKLISQNHTSQARVPQHDDSFEIAVDAKLYPPKDENITSSKEVSDMDLSIGPNVTEETVIEGISDPMAVRDNGETQFVDIPVEIEKQQCEEDRTVSSEIHATQVQIENLTDAVAEPNSSSQNELFRGEISEMENNGNNISDSDAINPDVTFGVESSYPTDPVSYTKPSETEAVSLQINEPDVVLDPNSVKGLADANETAENKDGEKEIASVETEVVAKDELSEKTTVGGVSVEIGAENLVNPSSIFFPETLVTADQVMGDIGENEQGSLVNVDDLFDAIEENNANNESVSYGMSGVGDSSFQAAHVKFDLGNVSVDHGENQGQQETYPLSTMEPEADAIDLNDNDSNDSPVGHDTGFLNADDDDDDEVAEADDDYVPGAGETHYLENSGWSSRTRAVANYLQTLFDKEPDHGKKVVPINDLLAGKTRKEASRMFFEALVLKTKDYIHVEQKTAFDNINILPRVKLMKSSF